MGHERESGATTVLAFLGGAAVERLPHCCWRHNRDAPHESSCAAMLAKRKTPCAKRPTRPGNGLKRRSMKAKSTWMRGSRCCVRRLKPVGKR